MILVVEIDGAVRHCLDPYHEMEHLVASARSSETVRQHFVLIPLDPTLGRDADEVHFGNLAGGNLDREHLLLRRALETSAMVKD